MEPHSHGSAQFIALLRTASVEAAQLAAAWLKEAMQQLVSIQCSGEHSPEGTPPYMESGRGRDSIQMNPLPNGAEVGVVSLGTPNMIGDNYMAGWDSPDGIRGFQRPWLSLWTRYESEMAQIMTSHLKQKTGAT